MSLQHVHKGKPPFILTFTTYGQCRVASCPNLYVFEPQRHANQV